MRVTILGCGGAGGVPLIGEVWGACDPHNPKNRRTRVSIAVAQDDTVLLVDTSPDMRQQLLRAGIKDVTAILYTHGHADHTHGIDDIRSLNWLTKRAIDVYGDKATIENLKTRFSYVFEPPPENVRFYKPSVRAHVIDENVRFESINVHTFAMPHGNTQTTGFRFNDFGYCTDESELDDKAFEILSGIKVWVVGAIRERPHPSHAHLDKVLSWIERLKPERVFLTHMDQSMDYEALCRRLPDHVRPAYDGLDIDL